LVGLFLAATYASSQGEFCRIISTLAGNGDLSLSGDGRPATSATLFTAGGAAVDAAGNLHTADTFDVIRCSISGNVPDNSG
jgi:hypothetical protein